MGQLIGTHKVDGYNTEEELDEMGLTNSPLIGRHDPDFDQDEPLCTCECCMIREKIEENQEHKDKLARTQLKLRIQGQVKLGKEADNRQPSTTDVFHDNEFDSKIRFTSSRGFTDLDKIYAAYPHNEFLVFMADGALVLMDTSGGGFAWDLILTEKDVIDEWYAEAVDSQHPWVRVWDIYIPGAVKIFTKEI